MMAATVTLASSSSSAINHGAASPSVGDGSSPPVSGLAEGSGSELAEGSGELIGLGERDALGDGVGLGDGVALAVLTGTPLQVAPQPVAVEDRVTKVRPLMPKMYPNTSAPAVGAFPVKMAEVRSRFE